MNRTILLCVTAIAGLLAFLITCTLPDPPPRFDPLQAQITISPAQEPSSQDTVGHPLSFVITYEEHVWLDKVVVEIRDPSKSRDSAIIFTSFPVEGISFGHTFDTPGPKTLVLTATYLDGTIKTDSLDYLVKSPQISATDTYTLSVATDGARGAVTPALPVEVRIGESAQISATAKEGFVFNEWKVTVGTAAINDPRAASTTITLQSDAIVRAFFVPATSVLCTLTVVTGENGTVSKNPDTTIFNPGDSVRLTARPKTGYYFGGWGGEASGTDPSITVTMTQNRTISATFTRIGSLGLTITAVNGTVTKSPDNSSYLYGDTVTLTAGPNIGYRFASWSGTLGAANPLKVALTESMQISATFARIKYRLNITSEAGGSITAPSPLPDSVEHGVATTIAATAAAGYSFAGWRVISGSATIVDSTQATTTVTLTSGDATVRARFSLRSYSLSVLSDGNGTVAPVTAQTVNHDAETIISATPNIGYRFTVWRVITGTAQITDSTALSTTVKLTSGNASIRAIFTQNTYTLTIPQPTNGTVVRVPANKTTFTHGETVTLTAQPATGYFFGGWGEDTLGTATSITVTMTRIRTISATFAIIGSLTLTTTAVNGTVTKSPDKASYQYGDQVTLTATPNAGYDFGSWSGGGSGNTNPVTITMDTSKSVTANFALRTYQLTVTTSTGGTIVDPISSPVTVNHGVGTPIVVTGSLGYDFTGWTVTSGTATIAVPAFLYTMVTLYSGAATIKANFSAKTYTIAYNLNGGTNHAGNPATYTAESAAITLYEPSLAGVNFVAWYSDPLLTNAVTQIPSGTTGDKTFYAKWIWDGSSTVTDIDSNVYTTVRIGNQVWTVENLRTTKFNDGSVIPHVTDGSTWKGLSTPGYCFYNNTTSSTERRKWGALYNGFAVNTGKLAPPGWRVPTARDWDVLANHLGGGDVAGGKMKQVGTTNWSSPNTGATNESGFSALPGGCRASDSGDFGQQGKDGYWYCYGRDILNYTPGRYLSFINELLAGSIAEERSGFSIRLVANLN